MSDVTISFDENALKELFASKDGMVAKHLLRRALSCANAAKRLCPVDTGRLRASITQTLGNDDKGLFAAFGTNVEYALYVEVGTRFMHAQPYLRPALTEETSK